MASHNNNGFNNIPEQPQYRVTRRFTGGNLEGLEYTAIQGYAPAVGFRCDNPIGGSPYEIIAVERVA